MRAVLLIGVAAAYVLNNPAGTGGRHLRRRGHLLFLLPNGGSAALVSRRSGTTTQRRVLSVDDDVQRTHTRRRNGHSASGVPKSLRQRERGVKATDWTRARDAAIFNELKTEAASLDHSALLGPAVRQQVLDSANLAEAVSEVLSSRLARASSGIMLPRPELKHACYRALKDDPRPGADILAILERDPAAISYLQVVMFLKGFHSVQAQRVSAKYWARGSMSSKHVALSIQNRVSELWSVDIHPAAWLGGGMLMDHATGIVIGETAVVGENCTILHSVTLGGTGKERGDRHPKVGMGVTLGAGATVLGNIKVNDGSTVGSQAVVTKDVPAGMTVVGLNNILDPQATPKRAAEVKARTETWQYEVSDNSYTI